MTSVVAGGCVADADDGVDDRVDVDDDDGTAGEDEDVDTIDPACTANGCLREVTFFGYFPRATLLPALAPGVDIDNGYSVFLVRYATDGRESTAALTIPWEGPVPEGGYPVVVNAHGTIGLDDPCQLSPTVSGSGLAGLFGARGAIGIAPDYPGLGTPGVHHYLSTREEGTSVLDAARAALHVARLRTIATNGRVAVVGLSQGGHAVLAAAALHASYAPELDVRAFGATAPASMFEEQWRPMLSFSGPQLPFAALLAWDWAFFADDSDDTDEADRRAVWAADFAGDVDDLMTTRCLWSPAFGPEPTLVTAMSEDPAAVFSPAFIEAWSSGSWGRFAFMAAGFRENRVVPFAQTVPIRIWQGTADTTVLPANTHALVDELNAGGMNVEVVDVPGGTHIDTAFGFVASNEVAMDDSIAWVQARLAE